MDKNKQIRQLKERIRKLEDENIKLLHWSQIHFQWAVGHNAERMADLERHRKQLQTVMKIKDYNHDEYDRLIKREAKKFFAERKKNNARH